MVETHRKPNKGRLSALAINYRETNKTPEKGQKNTKQEGQHVEQKKEEKKLTLAERYPDGINSLSPGAKELGAGETPACPHCGALTPFEGMILDWSETVLWLREVRKPCDCVGAQKERADAELKRRREEEAEKQKILALRREKAGIGKREALSTFANYTETEGNAHAIKTVRKYIVAVMGGSLTEKKMNSLYIHGSVGTGKTHLAAAMANELIEHGKRVVYTKFADLCRALKNAYEKDSKETEDSVLHRYRACPMLIIDDLGKEKPGEWSAAILYDIIDYRYRNLLPTVITSNFALENAPARLAPAPADSTAEAIVDRLYEAYYPVQVRGSSWRTMQKKDPFSG